MTIIEITSLENGAHMNQTTNSFLRIPDGWAVIPDDMDTPNFPFGDITVDKTQSPPVVTKWNPLPMPEDPVAAEAPTELEQLRADVDYLLMMTEG